MSAIKKVISINNEYETFYKELTSRNYHFVPASVQEKLKNFKILIAGCGSTGGACTQSLARLGVCNFYLADNGDYELSNLNRQHARLENLNQNKAEFHANEIKRINPYVNIKFTNKGITKENVDDYVRNVDLVFDAVDVTTKDGIEAKILLHKKCSEYKKPVLTGLDLGFLQWGRSYDYRNKDIKFLDGKADFALKANHPIASLFRIFPFQIVPTHCYQLVLDLLENKISFASQMGCTSDALSAIIVPAVLNFAESQHLITGWKLDLYKYRYSLKDQFKYWIKNRILKSKINKFLK